MFIFFILFLQTEISWPVHISRQQYLIYWKWYQHSQRCGQLLIGFRSYGNLSLRKNETGFLPICGCFSTTVWIHHLDANEMHGQKLHKNATCCFEQILEAAPRKTTPVRPLTFHLANHLSKTNKTCGDTTGEVSPYGLTPTHGRTRVDGLADFIRLLCADNECSLEDLPKVMDNWNRWWERERERERETHTQGAPSSIRSLMMMMILALCKMETTSSRIGTRVTVHISFNDNNYAASTSSSNVNASDFYFCWIIIATCFSEFLSIYVNTEKKKKKFLTFIILYELIFHFFFFMNS